MLARSVYRMLTLLFPPALLLVAEACGFALCLRQRMAVAGSPGERK
jgi:hypothetical protein